MQKIRYVAIEYGQAGFEPHKAEDTFKNKYGDCKDKAILLITMLKEAGLSAWPVLISTNDYYNLEEDFPSVAFNHAIAAIPVGQDTIFMDGTAEVCAFGDIPSGDQKRKVLVFKEDGFQIMETPLFSPEHNLLRQALKVKINNDETISGEKSIFSLGRFDQGQRYWLLYTQPELIRQTLQETVQKISIGSKLINYKIENLDDLNTPVVLNYAFSGPEYLTPAGSLRIMPQLASLDISAVALEKRKYPIYFDVLDTYELVYEFEIPSNFRVKYLPQAAKEENGWQAISVEYAQKNNKIIFKQKIETRKNFIPEGEYQAFKNFYEVIAKKIKQRVVLEKTK